MKLLLYAILMCSVPVLFGCKKTEPGYENPFLDPHYGSASLKLENVDLECLPYAITSKRNDTTVVIILVYLDSYNAVKGQLTISNVPGIIKTHPIITGELHTSEGPGAVYSSSNGDVGGDLFRYDTSLQYSYVELTEWDTITKQIQGVFEIQLLRSEGFISNPELPDTLNVQGSFLTKVDYK